MNWKPPALGPSTDARLRHTARYKGRAVLSVVLALFFIAVFVALGLWQLGRADEKRRLQAEYDQRSLQPPMELGPEVRDEDSLRFSRVSARGRYETEYQLLLDNRSHRGVPGFHVITPFRIAGSETRVLVNRGWVPMGPDRQVTPTLAPPVGEVVVTGTAVVPHVGFQLGEPPAPIADRPVIWLHLDLARYRTVTGRTLQPIVLLLDAQSGEGYVREWMRLDAGIAVHQGYAFQWFALATGVLVLYVVLSLRTKIGKRGKVK